MLRQPQVSSAIIGASRIEQLEENMKYAEVQLSAGEWKEVEAAIAGPKAAGRKKVGKATKKATTKKKR